MEVSRATLVAIFKVMYRKLEASLMVLGRLAWSSGNFLAGHMLYCVQRFMRYTRYSVYFILSTYLPSYIDTRSGT